MLYNPLVYVNTMLRHHHSADRLGLDMTVIVGGMTQRHCSNLQNKQKHCNMATDKTLVKCLYLWILSLYPFQNDPRSLEIENKCKKIAINNKILLRFLTHKTFYYRSVQDFNALPATLRQASSFENWSPY